MSTPAKIPVYLILGAPGSGRREVLADLIEGGLEAADKPVVLIQGGIHAGEIDGKDAGLMLLRDIALREEFSWTPPFHRGEKVVRTSSLANTGNRAAFRFSTPPKSVV